MEESRGEELALSCAQKFCCRTLDCAIVGQSNFFGHCLMEAISVSFDFPSSDLSVLCTCLSPRVNKRICPQKFTFLPTTGFLVPM